METEDFWRIPPISGNRESLAYILKLKEMNSDEKRFFVTVDGRYPNSLIKYRILKEELILTSIQKEATVC